MSTVDEKIKKVLELIDSDSFNAENSLPNLSRDELKKIVLMCEEDNYISHRSSTGKPLLQNYMDGGWSIAPTTFVTRSGMQFLEGFDRNMSQISQTYNIENVQNSTLGNYGTTINYSEQPIKELREYIDSLENKDDKQTGKELLKTLEEEDMSTKYLSRFEDFLNKYPKIIDLIASFVTSAAIGAFKS